MEPVTEIAVSRRMSGSKRSNERQQKHRRAKPTQSASWTSRRQRCADGAMVISSGWLDLPGNGELCDSKSMRQSCEAHQCMKTPVFPHIDVWFFLFLVLYPRLFFLLLPSYSLSLSHSLPPSLTHSCTYIHTHKNSPTITPPSLLYFLFPSCFSMLSLSLEKLVTCGVIRSYIFFSLVAASVPILFFRIKEMI